MTDTADPLPPVSPVDQIIHRSRQRRSMLGRGPLVPLLSTAFGLLLWEAAVRYYDLPSYLLPAPSEIIGVLFAKWRILGGELQYTALAALAGFLVATLISLVLGALIAASAAVERFLYIWLVIFHAVPKVVVAPLLLVWIGFGMKSSIIFVVVFTFFPILVSTISGLRSADPDLLLLSTSLGGSKWRILWAVRLPGAMPSIISGIKIAVVSAPVAAVVGEFVASNRGLGHLLIAAVGSLEVPTAFAAVFMVSFLGIAVWYLAEFLERKAVPWHASQR